MLTGSGLWANWEERQDMKHFKANLLAVLIVLGACASYPAAEFRSQSNGIVVAGLIDDTTFDGLKQALGTAPDRSTLVLQYVPGSVDDESCLIQLSSYIRLKGLTTRVPSDGLVASGGTDMAVMGARRIIEAGACIGVHTWAAGSLLGLEVGSDLPRNDPAHDLYLAFYRDMAITEDFYWFTLAAAGPDDVHWMSPDEINRFGLSSVPVLITPNETANQRSLRCEKRI